MNSRRSFLRLLGIGAVAAPVVAKAAQETLAVRDKLNWTRAELDALVRCDRFPVVTFEMQREMQREMSREYLRKNLFQPYGRS